MEPEVLAILVQPGAQAWPSADQRLVGDLHRRLSSRRIAIEHEQPRCAERLDHLGSRRSVPQLTQPDPTARLVQGVTEIAGVAEGHESTEHVPRDGSLFRSEGGEGLIGALGEGPGQSADRVVRLGADQPRHVRVEQLGERELQQREGGLIGDVRDDPCDQAGLVFRPLAPNRFDDRRFELVRGERRHGHRRVLQDRCEARVPERAVPEVGADREDDAQAGARVADGGEQTLDEAFPIALRRMGVQLLELIDDDEHLARLVGQDRIDRPSDAPLVGTHDLDEGRRLPHGDAAQRAFELFERVGARDHRRDEPCVRPCNRAGTQPGHQSGADCRRLARPRRTDDGEDPPGCTRSPEHVDESFDEPVTTEEIGGVGLAERPKRLERVGELADQGGRRNRTTTTSGG